MDKTLYFLERANGLEPSTSTLARLSGPREQLVTPRRYSGQAGPPGLFGRALGWLVGGRRGGLALAAVLVVLAAGCDSAPVEPPTAPTDSEVNVSACADLEAAHLAMCQRCGIAAPLPATTTSSALHYASCGAVTAVTDLAALYDTCLPALASGCFSGDTPPACHQLEF